jgi:hypothetical protein
VRVRPALAVLLSAALCAGVGVAHAAKPAPASRGAGSPGSASLGASLPEVGSGARPGPDVLYADAPRAPQLENVRGWKADPILVSGAQAYRDGEWVYQDFLFDDHGATGVYDRETPYGTSAHLYSPAAGTYTYPKDPVYAHNAADLVEYRLRPGQKATAFRVTLNTLQDAERTAFTIALGEPDAGTAAWPHGAGVSSPAELFLTWHGSTAELRTTDGTELPAPRVSVDLERRQVELVVPHTSWNPGEGTVRTTIGVGLWDTAAGSYLKPAPGPATAATPGGGTPNRVALVNVGPRFDEPLPEFAGATMGDTAALGAAKAPWWRERQQSLQLSLGDVTPFSAEVDFAKLAKKVRDDSGVPGTGSIDRIFPSRFTFGQGLDPDKVCRSISAGFSAGAACIGRQVGQLQPYNLYVPDKPQPSRGFGLTLLLHSLSANYNQYAGSKNQSQLGDRAAGSLVLTPAGRGPDGFYAGVAEADTFEAWNDVARHYQLDADWTTVTGYSMGGFGTYRLLARWPDLFSRGWSVVGTPGSVDDQLASLRNTPVMNWVAAGDELVNVASTERMQRDLTAAGLRHRHLLFPTADHLTLAGNDEYGDGADWLGDHRVDRDPAHVTYVVDPREDSASVGTADHAYWLSGLAVRDATAGPSGTIDVRSAASGLGLPPVLPVQSSVGVISGGQQPMAYLERSQSWGDAPAEAAADRLVVSATNIRTVTIDVTRAGVTCATGLDVTTDGPLTVVLSGCDRVEAFDRR